MITVGGLDVNYTDEQLQYFEDEMKKFKLPVITKAFKKGGVPFIKYSILPALVVITCLGLIYNHNPYWHNGLLWKIDKGIAFFYIFGFGAFTLTSKIAEVISTGNLRRRLGLSKHDFDILVIAFQITGM
jgi:hypothetical protein